MAVRKPIPPSLAGTVTGRYTYYSGFMLRWLDDQERKCMVMVLRRCGGGSRYRWWGVVVVGFMATSSYEVGLWQGYMRTEARERSLTTQREAGSRMPYRISNRIC